MIITPETRIVDIPGSLEHFFPKHPRIITPEDTVSMEVDPESIWVAYNAPEWKWEEATSGRFPNITPKTIGDIQEILTQLEIRTCGKNHEFTGTHFGECSFRGKTIACGHWEADDFDPYDQNALLTILHGSADLIEFLHPNPAIRSLIEKIRTSIEEHAARFYRIDTDAEKIVFGKADGIENWPAYLAKAKKDPRAKIKKREQESGESAIREIVEPLKRELDLMLAS